MIENSPYDLPIFWQYTRLGDICRTTSGGTPSRKKDHYFHGSIPWLKSGELNNGIIYKSEESITEEALNNSSAKIIPNGTLLIALYGATVGRLGILGIDASINQAICAIFPLPELDKKYLYWYLYSYRSELLSSRVGGAQPNISQQILLDVQIPVPPIAEQHRIVAKIEELFTQLDAGVEALKKAKEQLKQYRQAVLSSALFGEFTEEWRSTHASKTDSQKLLEAVKERRLARGIKGPIQEPNMLNLPSIPEEWVWVRLDTIAELKGGVTKDQKRKLENGQIVPYLRVANVQRGYLDLSEIKEIEASEEDIRELRLLKNDILFNEGGDRDKLGRGWIWQDELPICIHQNHVFRARLYLPEISSKFVSWCGNTYGANYFMREGKQTTNLASINLSKLSAFPVPLPSIEEQERIIAEIESRFSIIEDMEKSIDQSLAHAETLRQSILSQAFSGKLVPKDPNDEPAEKLLERIRLESLNQQNGKTPNSGPKRARKQATLAAD